MNPIKKVPVPACGVALGLAALGNLIQTTGLPNVDAIRLVCGALSAFLIVLFVLKCICYPSLVAEDMKNPISASVICTFAMTLMQLSVYVKPWIGDAAYYTWLVAIAIHVLLIVYFTLNFIIPGKFKLAQVFASYFIVYVGLSVASVTAPAYAREDIGTMIFWFGFVSLLILLVVVTMRYVKCPVPEPARPVICIYAAPASLCIAGYVQSVTPKSLTLLLCLYALACVLYLVGLLKAVQYLRLKFYPSFASFTFPLVISGIATRQVIGCAAKLGSPLPEIFGTVAMVQTVIATVVVFYVFLLYLKFLFTPIPTQK